jgi:hypothetical protein
MCVRGPASRLGETCVANDDCAEGACVEREGVFLCAAECGAGCPGGTSCVDDVCWPEGDLPGAECDEDGAECDVGRCESVGSYLLCVEGCDNATDCPSGQSCVPDGDFAVCVPSRIAFVAQDDDDGCTCSAAGSTRPDALIWALGLALAVAALRRRG